MAIFNIFFSFKSEVPQKPKIAQISKALNVSERTVARYKRRSTKISYLGTKKPILSPLMYRCNRDTSLPGEVINKVIEFVRNHKDVRVSPLWRDVLLIKGDPVPKLLRECPIRELLNDVYAAKIEGISDEMSSHLLSYEKFRLVLKQKIPEMRKASNRHKQLCGCEICITVRTAHIALNKYRVQNLKLLKENCKILNNEIKEFVCTHRSSEKKLEKLKYKKDCLQKRVESYEQYCFVNHVARHENASDAVKTLYCKEVVIDNQSYPHFSCTLGFCNKCPSYVRHEVESTEIETKTIRFEHYTPKKKCSIHGEIPLSSKLCTQCNVRVSKGEKIGKIIVKKFRTCSEWPISRFFSDHYLPLMDSYKYHYTHVRLLSKTGVGGERISAFLNDPSSILTKRDYAESIEAKMNDEIQGDHYGEQGRIKLEGATAQYHINSAGHIDVDDVERINGTVSKNYYAHFLDDAKQSAATSYENFYEQILHMINQNIINMGATRVIYDHTDGCRSQY
jgi:hypothetical protein